MNPLEMNKLMLRNVRLRAEFSEWLKEEIEDPFYDELTKQSGACVFEHLAWKAFGRGFEHGQREHNQ